ncbi:MAG: AbrB/MazE/SpoVT family DNA-binding domain-containing protein [Thermoplasmatales archaeon]|nr:AbrB/MazE/SpoVT family DNA-binding domain-containing protein [Thermoplasmatales archaeon]
MMKTVVVSQRFQVTIPKRAREKLNITPGEKIGVIEKDGIIHLISIIDTSKPLRGNIF